MRLLVPSLLLLLAPACRAPRAIRHVNPPGRTDTRPYSHGVVAGGFYFVAGTTGVDLASGAPPADPADEARTMLDGFRAKLELVGLGMDDLVQVQVFCSDVALYETFNQVYAGYFERDAPARAFVGSGPLLSGCHFEIQGIAALP